LFHDVRSSSAHPSEVEAGWQVILAGDGSKLFQLSTYGSDTRQSKKKVSQTIQMDETTARELMGLLASEFGF